jgi:hypothetical protein
MKLEKFAIDNRAQEKSARGIGEIIEKNILGYFT